MLNWLTSSALIGMFSIANRDRPVFLPRRMYRFGSTVELAVSALNNGGESALTKFVSITVA